MIKSLHWLSIPIIYTDKQNRKEKRDSPYPLFSIRYNRRCFIKFHITNDIYATDQEEDPKEERLLGIYPLFLSSIRMDQRRKIPAMRCTIDATNEMFERERKKRKKKEMKISRYLIPSPCYQTSNAVDRGH